LAIITNKYHQKFNTCLARKNETHGQRPVFNFKNILRMQSSQNAPGYFDTAVSYARKLFVKSM